jgi:hypothetical protein
MIVPMKLGLFSGPQRKSQRNSSEKVCELSDQALCLPSMYLKNGSTLWAIIPNYFGALPYFFNTQLDVTGLELVSKELNHFGVIAGLFRQIGGHSSRFVLFCSFWRLFTIKMIKSVKVFPFSFWKIITFFLLYKIQTPGINMQNGRQVI